MKPVGAVTSGPDCWYGAPMSASSRRLVLCGLVFAVMGCPKKEEAPAEKPAAAKPSASAPAAPKIDLESAKVALPETQGTPEKKTADFGGGEVTIEVCALDTALPPMADPTWERALPSMTAAPDGSLYVLDPKFNVRHYVNRAHKGCELVLDRTFGKDGLLDAGLSDNYQLSSDAKGTIYAGSGSIGMKGKKIVDGKVDKFCDGTLRMQPSSTLVLLGGNQLLDDLDKCRGKSVSFHEGFDPKAPAWASPRPVGLYGDEIVVRGMDLEKTKEVRKIGLHGADGKQRIKLGKAEGDESMWSPDAATTCAGDLCVFEMTRGSPSILRWKKDGTFVKKLKLDVVDFSGRSLAAAGDTLWVAGGGAAKAPGIVGVILRVRGVK